MSETQTQDTRWKPSAEQAAILHGLLDEQNKEKNQADFVRRFLPFGGSKWSQILGVLEPARFNAKGEIVESYFDRITEGGREETFEELKGILERIPLERAVAARAREQVIFKTSKIKAMETAIRECAEKAGPERIVLMLAPTGGGKTVACNYLATRHNARIVEVRDVWRHSATGNVPLRDICQAVGVRAGRDMTMPAMEDALVRYCLERKIILAFDEGEHFGRSSLNLLKFLLNKTRAVAALFVVPSEFARWEKFWPNEFLQISRRFHECIKLDELNAADVAMFFPPDQFAAKECLGLVCTEAKWFGHYSLVRRVSGKLAGVSRASLDDTKLAIDSALAQMGRSPVSFLINREKKDPNEDDAPPKA